MTATPASLIAALRRFGPAAAVMAAIFAFSATPSRDLPDLGGWDFLAKKGAHAFGYALLGAAYAHALNPGRRPTRGQAVLAIGLAALYAASDEWHQSMTPGRHPAWMDVGIDMAGAAVGVSVLWRWLK